MYRIYTRNLIICCCWILTFRQPSIWGGFEGKCLAESFLFSVKMEVVKIHFCFFFFSARDLHPSFAVIASLFSTSFFFFNRFLQGRLSYLVCKFYGNYFQNDILSDPGKWVYKIRNYVSVLRMLFNVRVFLKVFQSLLACRETPSVWNTGRSQQPCTRHL